MPNITIDSFRLNKACSVSEVAEYLKKWVIEQGYIITETEIRPWGGYHRIGDEQVETFIGQFFPGFNFPAIKKGTKLSPKIQFIGPSKRQSWQYHERRSDIWVILHGPLGVYLSDTDTQPQEYQVYEVGSYIDVPPKKRHRVQGIDGWAVVPEIWVHADQKNLSDESDIRRIEDDFGR